MPHDAKTENPDATSLLKADHRNVEGLFERYEKSESKTAKAKLAHDICLELAVHATIEEELFYPAIKASVEKEISDEAYVEHDGMKVLIAELVAVDLISLGVAMLARKKELTTQMKSAGLAAPATRSMKGAELQRASPIA